MAKLIYPAIASLDGYVAIGPASSIGLRRSAEADLTIGGPDLAAHAFRAGLVDECQLFLAPTVVGGGNRSLPDQVRLELELLDERRFAGGMVYLRYGVAT